jgi:propionyl-CoA synthetase
MHVKKLMRSHVALRLSCFSTI